MMIGDFTETGKFRTYKSAMYHDLEEETHER